MAKKAKVLTAPAVAKMKHNGGRLPREIADGGASHLYFIIYPSGRKSWAIRYRRPGSRKPNKLVLGSVSLAHERRCDEKPVIGGCHTIPEARWLAAELNHQIALGKDPAALHRQAVVRAASDCFGRAATDFVEQSRKTTRRWRDEARLLGLQEKDGSLQMIERGLAWRWRDKPLTEIVDDDIFQVTEEARTRGVPGLEKRTEQESEARARKLHSVLSTLFNWLTARRRVRTSPMMGLKRPAPPPARDRVLNAKELVALWRATDQMRPPFRQMFQLLSLTGQRLREVAQMTSDELSADGTWVIPSHRTKNGRAHVVPLSAQSQAIIASLKRLPECKFVFSTNGRSAVSGFSTAKKQLDSKMKDVPAFVVHDLRRSCATGMADIGIQPHVIEAVLNHVSGHKAGVAGVYNRSEYAKEKAEALQRWADHIERLVSQ